MYQYIDFCNNPPETKSDLVTVIKYSSIFVELL